MSTKDFRAATLGAIEAWGAASFPDMPIVYENGPVLDEDKIGPIWLDIEVRWYGGRQLAIGGRGRHTGAVSANVFFRDASGTGAPDDVLDSLKLILGSRKLGGGTLGFPQRTVPTNLKGWYKTGLLFPFTLDV